MNDNRDELYDSNRVDLFTLARAVYKNSKAHGFWGDTSEERREQFPLKAALIMSEGAELFEALRKAEGGYQRADKDLTITAAGEEIADIIIRCLDLAWAMGICVRTCLQVKHSYNMSRPYKHDKRF